MADPIVAALHEFYTNRNAEFARQIEGVSDEGLNSHAGLNHNSLFETLNHALDVERGNIVTVTGANVSFERRPNMVGTAALAEERLRQAAEDLDTYLHDGAKIDPSREVTMYRREMSVALALAFGLGHVNEHLGHLQVARQLWDQFGQTGKSSDSGPSERYTVAG